MNIKLKVCGMKFPDNIAAIAELQPDYLGFIFYKGSKRYVADLSAAVLQSLPAGIKKTGVFVDEEPLQVAALTIQYGLNAVQLHGKETVADCLAIKQLLPAETELIKAFGVGASFDFDVLKDYMDVVDYFLFDTQTPGHGGSGKTFDWLILEKYTLNKPYFLSGGISLNSIDELNKIKDTRLYAVDVNSRFELEPGLKDTDQLMEFKNMMSY
ncbi:phosphoribosylanthranilate isomerase [Pedobacter metabolipauper]|uniref:N-(5'-phosphoribosyl)anthranilate isomerase n=2 Tax=Pedobacter metabolipauper TaxID=425513 RepID=A0A4R6SUS3_9SPHI|nr:phosphoribosylanthranilate isomerase [Pedobacter metabolipauper]